MSVLQANDTNVEEIEDHIESIKEVCENNYQTEEYYQHLKNRQTLEQYF